LVTEIYWAEKKNSIARLTSIIDWTTKFFQVACKIFFWSKLEKNLVAQFGYQKLVTKKFWSPNSMIAKLGN